MAVSDRRPGPADPSGSHAVVQRQYGAMADAYDRQWSYYTYATLTATLDAVSCAGDEHVLDIACGTGELARLLLAQWPELRVSGLDLSRAMLRRAWTKLRGNPHATLACGAASALPYRHATFDLVTCTNTYHYFRRPDLALAEMDRVLRPGGRLVIVDWCHDYWTCKACHWYLRLRDPAYVRMYTSRACGTQLLDAGFEVLEGYRFKISRLWGLMTFVGRKTRRLHTTMDAAA